MTNAKPDPYAGKFPPAPTTPMRDLVVRLADCNGQILREWRVPLTEIGPHQNTQYGPTVEATIETHAPEHLGLISLRPWGAGQ
jgi:hypothetical protein